MQFTRAIVKPPGTNFAMGISSIIGGGQPDVAVAITQHDQYCETLRGCGLRITKLAADLRYPDSTFIEDTAVLTSRAAIIARPGAKSRVAETAAAAIPLGKYYEIVYEIEAPGTLDGGDVCEVDGDFLIGLSGRTNTEGARQLTALLRELGHKSVIVDIRSSKELLHLKSGLSYLGDGVFVASPDVSLRPALERYEVITVSPAEAYAANCIRVNDYIMIAAGYPRLFAAITSRGYRVATLPMSEFKKMDGGLSCLSLRF